MRKYRIFHFPGICPNVLFIGTKDNVKRAFSFVNRAVYFSFFIFHFSLGNAQQYNTCENAATVDASSFIHINCKGAPDQLCSQYFAQEHNIAWLTFVIPEDTLLTFDIVPYDTTQDLDFLLFEDQTGNFCENLSPICPAPIRLNIANPGLAFGGRTGLSASAGNIIELSGNHSSYCKALKVKKGERFYLVVDNVSGPGLFSFNLHLVYYEETQSKTPDGPSFIDARPVKVPPMHPVKSLLLLKITDTAGNLVKAQLDITGFIPNKTITRTISEDSFALDPLQKININCNAIGYFFEQVSYTASNSAERNTIIIRLHSIKENESIVLKGIEFEESKAALLPSSNTPLMNLLSFMKNNPKVKITIKGYVNDPYGYNSGKAKALSKKRAEAVYSFLQKNGIEESRMKYQGCGGENMIFPKPVNQDQEQANRRVEITIE